MEFKEFLQLEIRGHVFDRLQRIFDAARNSPHLIPNPNALAEEIKRRAFLAEQIYSDGQSYAVQLYRFPFIVGERRAFTVAEMRPNEPSNGNLVVGIIRDANMVTLMFRRSNDLGRISQPWRPEAMSVDHIVDIDEFMDDMSSMGGDSATGTTGPPPVATPPRRPLRGGI